MWHFKSNEELVSFLKSRGERARYEATQLKGKKVKEKEFQKGVAYAYQEVVTILRDHFGMKEDDRMSNEEIDDAVKQPTEQ